MKQKKMRRPELQKSVKVRMYFMLACFIVCLIGLIGRVAYLKTVHGEEYEAQAKVQQINRYDTVITPNRGNIVDRNDQALAVSVAIYNVVLDPLVLSQNNATTQAETISTLCTYFPELQYDTLQYYISPVSEGSEEINLNNHWKYLVKGIEQDEKDELEALNLKGVYYEQTSRRAYPLSDIGAHAIGFIRGDTSWGLESYYNDYMSGETGRSFILYEQGNSITYQDYDAKDGSTLVTTIDYMMQQYAEQAVAESQEMWPCEKTVAIVMDPNTGEVFAMAESDPYDLNDPSTPLAMMDTEENIAIWEAMTTEEQVNYLNNMWKCFTVSSTYEPGSVFKPMVVAAALEEGIISMSDTFYCGGSVTISGMEIGCHLASGHGIIDVEEVLAQSCNMGMIQIAEEMGAEIFYEYQKEFGFGELTGIDIGGEASASSLLHSVSALGATELATSSFGQTFNATSIQIISAMAALINGGNIIEPHLVSHILDSSGNVVYENKNEVIRKVISEETSDTLRLALKATVDHGTGTKIAIPGYSIGCKTGTGEQGDRTRDDLWALTHIAYFPAENPEYLVMGLMYMPETYTDGVQSTAPLTKSIIENIIKYKNMEPTVDVLETTSTGDETVVLPDYTGSVTFDVVNDLDARGLTYTVVGTGNTVVNQIPKATTGVTRGSEIILYVEKAESDSGTIPVPNVIGKTYDEANEALVNAGFTVIYSGSELGVVTSQSPQYGISMSAGESVELVFELQYVEEIE
ncbi:penicillin-binding transpeptidase domain-containing protein [Chakrabartyella piscis]|uniref:penicillin-binding transpeptidase domain-containing protein n=1 Tax=Chakrabartyella piscis TaxID=2918914 RepID=UPI0029589209|nr:penicillin-binding transpeptidase domain-containing protein [Chakrabartyella piscis]